MEKGLAAVPGDPGLLVGLAQALRQRELDKPKDRRDWQAFDECLGQAELAAGNAPEIALLRADGLADRGQLEEALKRIEAAVAGRRGRSAPGSPGSTPWPGSAGPRRRWRCSTRRRRRPATTPVPRGPGPDPPPPRRAADGLRGAGRRARRMPADQRPILWPALGEYHQGRKRLRRRPPRLRGVGAAPARGGRAPAGAAEPGQPRGDGPAMEAQAEAIRKIVGPNSVVGKVARAEVLLNLKPPSADGKSGGDKARLDEVEKLVAEVKAAAPRQASGYLIEARLRGRLGHVNEQVAAYSAALDLRGGQAALRPLVVLLVKDRRDAEKVACSS